MCAQTELKLIATGTWRLNFLTLFFWNAGESVSLIIGIPALTVANTLKIHNLNIQK